MAASSQLPPTVKYEAKKQEVKMHKYKTGSTIIIKCFLSVLPWQLVQDDMQNGSEQLVVTANTGPYDIHGCHTTLTKL